MIIKCKMCGGDLNIQEGNPICECEFCGTQQTIPQADNEKKVNLFNRANRLRMNSEFDKAAAIYTSITAEFPHEAEAYWGLCLCKFGIEYVDDPLNGNKVPTCHRTLTTSILDDSDYIQATQNTDAVARSVYESEAKRIDELQQDILQIVKSETPYDVFICYKETDENGDRTEDSVIAHEIYDALSGKGLKVFFARVTLEDKLGQQYEPYIFAALQSAKVMLVVGTSYDYLDAVWVKNEWSRFLDMMKTDRTKKLIPCFKGIEIDEMPKAFQRLQAQDLSKLGWEQDLIRGVIKICGKQDEKVPVAASGKITNNHKHHDLLERAEIYLEDGLWDNAERYCRQYLRVAITDPDGYWIMLLIDKKAKNTEDLINKGIIISEENYYQKVLQYSNKEEKEKYEAIADEIKWAVKKKYNVYITDLKTKVENAQSINEYNSIIQDISKLYEFSEVKELKEYCQSKLEEYKKQKYHEAIEYSTAEKYEEAIAILTELGSYKDANGILKHCKIAEQNQRAYQGALSLKERGHWAAAADTFRNLGDYRDSIKQAKICSRKAKQAGKSTTGQKIAIIIHMLIAAILITGIATIGIKDNNTIKAVAFLIGIIVIPILIWKGDKRKSTKRIILDIFICFANIILFGALMKPYGNNMGIAIISSLIMLFTIII